MPLESVFLEFLDEGGLFGTGYPVMMKNINWRLRLKEDMTKYPPEFMQMWADFFSLLGNQGQMTSDKLMAAAQKMFEIEQYIKTVPIIYGKSDTYSDIIQSLSAQLGKSTDHASKAGFLKFKEFLEEFSPLIPPLENPYENPYIPKAFPSTQVFHPKKGKK